MWRPPSDRGLRTLGHRRFGLIFRPAVGSICDQEVEFFRGMVALPIPAVVGEKVAVIFNPHAIKRISHAACQDPVVTGGGVDPEQSCVSLIGLVANIAR